MKISYNWLKQYVNCDYTAEKVSELLTSTGLEVEDLTPFESVKGALKGVVVGKVLTCVDHPNSDHLHITTVDCGGEEPLHIVCGAPNVAAGQKVLVATIGTDLWIHDEQITIKKGKIRGEVSEGMICAEDELQLGESHDGIMVLPENYEVGKPASFYFPVEEDYTIEIGLTANRSDATSHIGSARDLVAALNQRENTTKYHLITPSVDDFKVENHNNDIEVVVEDTAACPRYSGLSISGVKVGPSPEWLKNRLAAVGIRSINNIVDISNYVLMEVGQPMHIFDADKITGKKVIVKCLPEGTPFVTLDGVERKLNGRNLMICNTEEPMCIAGVFGGLKSGVTEETTNIFLESAYFNPTSIRKTSKFHGLQTDASFRYERGADPNITLYALKRAAMLVKELAGGTISSEIKDVINGDFKPAQVDLKFDYLNKLAGQDIDKTQAVNILKSLECKVVEQNDQHVVVDIPTCKVDVTRPADVVEEILRIYGYDNIAIPSRIHASISRAVKPNADQLQQKISDMLVSNGFYEIMNNSLTKSAYSEAFEAFPAERNVKIMNPLSSDLNVMRQTLLWGGLESIAFNQNRKVSDMKFFEFGNVYFFNAQAKNEQHTLAPYSEFFHLDLFLTGNRQEELWNHQPKPLDFFDLKQYVMGILHQLRVDQSKLEVNEGTQTHFEYSLMFSVDGQELATIGKLDKKTLKLFDIKKDVFYATLNWTALMCNYGKAPEVHFEPLSKFPSVRRDLAMIFDKSVTFEQVKKVAMAAENKLLQEMSLFDVYEGEKIPEGKKQYAMSFILMSTTATLTDKAIEKAMTRIQQAIEKELNGVLR
ncbi:MAG: phenylalanine--tRNA ligase subunit beta [Bacteroidales bacterium]|nr:phenylalanine--tRNA ligase subunit beta [Bacteroidales bacterium]MBQ6101246.1 phenylalanine--tRNA ligase subunit beta [Bacteroidales bacterium]